MTEAAARRAALVELGITARAAVRALRAGRPLDRLASFLAVAAGLGFVVIEGVAFAAALEVSRKALPALPALRASYLVEKLLLGGFGAAAFLLLLGSLTTAVSTLFLSEELPARMVLPLPHRRLFARQLRITLLSASAPTLLLAAPIVLVASAASPRPLVAALTAFACLAAVVALSGSLGGVLALLLVSAVSPRRARLLAAFLSAAGLGAALVGFRVARPERVLDPVSALLLLERVGQTPPAAPGMNPAAWGARLSTAALFGDASALLPALALLAATLVAPFVATRLFWRRHLLLFQKTRESEGRVSGAADTPRVARSLTGELARAEARSLFRDASTPAQLGSLAAVFVLDLLNVRLLPNTDPASRDVVAGLQTALALFLVAALSLRFAYPAVSSDGRSALVLRTIPLSPSRHLAMRYVIRALPSLVMTLVLVALSDAALAPGRAAVVASLVVGIVGALALPALNLGLGALFPRYDAPNAVAVALGPGGLVALTLSTALALVAGVAASDELRILCGSLLSVRVPASALLFGWCAAAALAAAVPLALGARALESADRTAG